jgi:protein involved in polysaccharide export with SLBB domain
VADEAIAAPAEATPSRTVTAYRATISNNARHSGSQQVQTRSAQNGAIENEDRSTLWYDLALAHDRDQLKAVVLAEGDAVTVKEVAPPLRIGGTVNRPGAYPLPPGRALNAWQAIELAGGVRDETIPLNITLLRPAGEGRGARRWYLNVAQYQEHPTSSPFVEPGDVLQIEPTTGGKIKRAVGDLWSKP